MREGVWEEEEEAEGEDIAGPSGEAGEQRSNNALFFQTLITGGSHLSHTAVKPDSLLAQIFPNPFLV